MDESATNKDTPPIRNAPIPPVYLTSVVQYLQQHESEVWDWFASHSVQQRQHEAIRFELLKSTYRVEPESQPELYDRARQAAGLLSLDVDITIYQAQYPLGLNASLAFLPDEAHIVLHGPVAAMLDNNEMSAVLAHELGHLLLWRGWQQDYLNAAQVLAALSCDAAADTPHFETARLFGLYSEIFCDRAAMMAVPDHRSVVTSLLKLQTDLKQVDADAYLRQADEIIQQQAASAEHPTHPEPFIRARAIDLWARGVDQADSQVSQMIQGHLQFERMDSLDQLNLHQATRKMWDLLLMPEPLRTDATLAQAKLYFPDYEAPNESDLSTEWPGVWRTDDAALQEYYSFVLLDFATADRDLETAPLARAKAVAERSGWEQAFADRAIKELKLRKKQFAAIQPDTLDG